MYLIWSVCYVEQAKRVLLLPQALLHHHRGRLSPSACYALLFARSCKSS